MTNLFLMLLIGFTPAAFGDASCSKDLQPLKKTQPAYPKKALAQDLHGWVTLEFTVNADGSISDATVIENCVSNGVFYCEDKPNDIFDNSALKASTGFVYKTGEACEGVQNRLTYSISIDGDDLNFKGDKAFYCDRLSALSAIALKGFGANQAEKITRKQQKSWHQKNDDYRDDPWTKNAKVQLAKFAQKNGALLRKNIYKTKNDKLRRSMAALTKLEILASSKKSCLSDAS